MDDVRDTKSRKWLLTVNNPEKYGYDHDFLKSTLQKLKGVTYWCMSDEVGFEGTYHTHIFVYAPAGLRASTLHKKLEKCHRDLAKGTCLQNRDYVFKEGKWKDSEKETTNLKETHEEYGECPVEHQGKRNDIDDLYVMIKDGMTTYEILDSNPQYIMQIDKIDKVRQTIKEEEFKNTWRNLEVNYIWGKTGTGKTRHVMEKYGYSNVYRVTDYLHPFDAYKGQDVIVFEEFRSSLYLDDMLKYLDGYPVEFPARYNNKVACFTKVYIITNIDLREQYPNVQKNEPMSWQAFLRRIHTVKVFTGSETVEMPTETYLKEEFRFTFNAPFDKEVVT